MRPNYFKNKPLFTISYLCMIKPFLIIVFVATLLEVFADILFKKWSVGGKGIFLLIGVSLYTVGTVAWAYSLRFELLSRAISVFTVLNFILVVLAGVIIFKESLSLANKAGIMLGIVSVVLL